MRHRWATAGVFFAVASVAWQLATAAPANADDGVVLVSDTGKVKLVAVDDGEGTADVVVENQGATEVQVSAKPGGGAADGCEITPTKGWPIPAHRQQAVTFTFSADCDIDRTEGTNFAITVGESSFALHANPPARANPDWVAVGLAYIIAVGIAAAVLGFALWTWTSPRKKPGESKFWMPLPGLSDSWKFADSWSANATVVTALFAGIFGAQGAAEALLGEGAAKDVLAVAVVSAAVSLGLTGMSPMILQSLRTRIDEVPEVRSDGTVLIPKVDAAWYVTPVGLLTASLFTLVGTGGQLGAILWAVKNTQFGKDWAIGLVGVAGAAGLTWYAWQTTRQSLDVGAKTEPPADVAKDIMTVVKEKMAEAQVKQANADNLKAKESRTTDEVKAITADERTVQDLQSEAAAKVASLRSALEVAQSSRKPSPIP